MAAARRAKVAAALGVVVWWWWWWAVAVVGCGAQPVVVGSYGQPRLWLKPYDWSYLRVELPPSFSSVTMDFATDRDIQREHLKDLPRRDLAIICLMNSNPPIPDISDSFLDTLLSNFLVVGSFGSTNNQSDLAQCIPFQKNTTIVLRNDQISPGIWYIGYFNGLGPARTQSKMISRGRARSVSTSITVEGCPTSALWGPYCNQTIEMISCSQSSGYNNSRNLMGLNIDKRKTLNTREHTRRINFLSQWNHLEEKGVGSNSTTYSRMDNSITCAISNGSLCLRQGDMKFYFLDVVDLALQFEITATNFGLAQRSSLICYLRYNAFPRRDLHDYSASTPLLDTTCFSLEWQVTGCLNGKAGTNCSWEAYVLQRVPKRSPSVPFESYYVPSDGKASLEYSHFSLEQFLSNSSFEPFAWTYFFLDIPEGSAGALIHVQIKSDKELNYELYSRYGGLPSNESWDYYASRTSSSNGSVYFSLQNSTNSDMDLSIFYAKEGTWCFGVKHPSDKSNSQTYMSISLQGCHKNCNQKGACHSSIDESGLTFYSFCTCDRDHGGFDCNDELVSPNGHIWQSVFLIASNGAAILPAFWALRQKAFAEWILYTSSGISSALYHSCDVGTWCILSFRVLQFLDFWLSFMAVVGTFIYMATIDETSKRAMHTAVFILTALLAATGATRSANIGIVIAIGSLGLLIGWLLEFSTARRFVCWPWRINLNVPQSWPNLRSLFWNSLDLLNKRFRWFYLLLGFITLAFAGTSWKLESNRSYWVWHSLWHITIYTSSFFFLCSMRINTVNHSPEPSYELTRQNSLPRSEPRET
uniref:EGF-like domain-containing protein n=3 Tax=Oryza TaxID=4527 RepID=A0A0E0QZR1_ORYRU